MVDVDHVDELDAEHWIARSEREATELGVGRFSQEFWREGALRIADNRRFGGLGSGVSFPWRAR